MRMCQQHWDALRSAIEARGLGHLIAANGGEAVMRMKAELHGKSDLDDFDPLMAAHNLIGERSVHVFGLWIMQGALCPVCELLKVTPPPPAGHRYATNELYFIDGPADSVLAFCEEHGIATAPEAP